MDTKTAPCTLCNAEVAAHPILDGINTFCCAGCHAVFNILSFKNQLEGFESNPIFVQALRSGLISNPALLDMIERQRDELRGGEREKLYLEIADMWCPSCAEIIKLMVMQEKGVVNCVIDYSTDLAAIEYSPRHISKDTLISLIGSLGYRPMPLDSGERKAVSTDLYLRFAVAAFCSLNIMMFAYPLYATYFSYDGEGYGPLFAWMSLAVCLPVVFYSAWPIWRRFANSLTTGVYGMETLVFLGVGAAFAVSIADLLQGGTRVYFDTMSVIIVFVLLGKIIEARAKFSAKESLMRLTKSSPRRGRKRFEDGSLRFTAVKEIVKGDILVAYAGERMALDGVVVEGSGACDESLMTGESMPISKKEGEGILGGSILVKGQIAYKVVGSYEESALHKIIEMVERDVGHKSVYVRAADRIIRWFVPAVLCIAAATALGWWMFPGNGDAYPGETAWLRALAVLLISCPCAIGIAAPTAESYLLNALASIGVIVRNRGCLPYLGNETVIIFDKTGTVTEGRFKVHEGLEDLSEKDRVALLSLASRSIHPVACAIASALTAEGICGKDVVEMEEVVGHGLTGTVAGERYLLGSTKFVKLNNVAVVDNKPEEGIFSSVYFAKEKTCLTVLKLGDRVRDEVAALVEALKPAKTVLLSGDDEAVVAKIAKKCGFDSWRSGCSPLDKREYVEQQKSNGEKVCMLGDGINDAPALTVSHVGVSVVNATDMSIQVSDLLLTTDNLSVLTKMRKLSRSGHRIVQQNLFWAFFFNVIGIFLAVIGILSPIFAAFAMSISSVAVLFNARRLRD